MSKLVIIDGNSLLFRAYFAMRPMVTSDGVHTQGVYAFINMLNKITRENEPDYIAVCFDMKEKTFRHEVYPEYKAGRLQTPIELLSEIPIMHRVLEAMNIKVLEMPRYEADDLIGTVTKRASEEGIKSLVISGDKDELQLVDENTHVLINKKGMSEFTIYDLNEMKERYSLTPTQFIDLKGLMGDKSDNIPGIAGVGEKKGIALLTEYGTLENVVEHADEIKGKLGENVRASVDVAILSKKLATICREAPIDWTWDELRFVEPDYDKLTDIYTELEFRNFIKALGSKGEEAATDDSEIINEIAWYKNVDVQEFWAKVPAGSEVVIDCATDFSHTSKPEITKVAMLAPMSKLYTIKELTPMDDAITLERIASAGYKLSGYDIKRLQYSADAGYDVEFDVADDITIAEYLINPNQSKYLLTKMMLNYQGITVPEASCDNYDKPLAEELDDLSVASRLLAISKVVEAQHTKLDALWLTNLYRNIEMPLIKTISSMEKYGIAVKKDVLESIGNDIDDKTWELEKSIYDEAGREFNINSPKQLGTVLFDELLIPYPKKKGSSYSTAQDILDKLKDDYQIVGDVLTYRKLAKLKSTYIDGLITLIADDGCIHPHFMQTVAATGRLSCTEPNLQNIPIRDDYGREIRKAFVTRHEESMFTGADYSQIELRIMAALSGDENLISAFRNGQDIHRSTASRVFGIPFDEVTKTDRSRAKAVNFGVIYGMSGFGLSENLCVSRKEAERYISDYFEKHKAVKDYLGNQIKIGEEERAVRTLYGRLRQIPEFASRKFMERELAKRLAMNTPIQGTAADIIKIAMNSVYKELVAGNFESKLILQIHDELIVEGPASEAADVADLIIRCMEGAADLAVKLECEVNSADNWFDLK